MCVCLFVPSGGLNTSVPIDPPGSCREEGGRGGGGWGETHWTYTPTGKGIKTIWPGGEGEREGLNIQAECLTTCAQRIMKVKMARH